MMSPVAVQREEVTPVALPLESLACSGKSMAKSDDAAHALFASTESLGIHSKARTHTASATTLAASDVDSLGQSIGSAVSAQEPEPSQTCPLARLELPTAVGTESTAIPEYPSPSSSEASHRRLTSRKQIRGDGGSPLFLGASHLSTDAANEADHRESFSVPSTPQQMAPST